MNRSDLMDQFGVSVNQASTDLNRLHRLRTRTTWSTTRARGPYVRGPGLQVTVPRARRQPLPRAASIGRGRDPRPRGLLDRRSPAYASAPDAGARRQSGDAPLRGRRHPPVRGDRGESTSPCPARTRAGGGSRRTPSRSTDFRWHTRAFCLTDKCVQGLPALTDPRHPRIAGERKRRPTMTATGTRSHAGGRPPPRPLGDAGEGHRARLRDAGRQRRRSKSGARCCTMRSGRRLGLDTDPGSQGSRRISRS